MIKKKHYKDIVILKMGRSLLGKTLYSVHAFILNNIMIDTGTYYVGKGLIGMIEGMGINTVLNTHYHEDHTGNNHSINKHFGAKIMAHHDSIPFIENPDKNHLRLYQKITWGKPEKSTAEPLDRIIVTDDYNLKVIETEGHSKGGVCFYEERKKYLFSGDMFCGAKNVYFRSDESFSDILKSVEMLSNLEIKTLFCGLKGVVENGGDALKRKTDFMYEIKEKALKLRKEGMNSITIRKKVLGKEDMMNIISGGHFCKQNLINSLLSENRV